MHSPIDSIKLLPLWLKDDLLKRLLVNAGTLISGNVAASLIGLVSLILTARVLGPEQFGILVLINTYVHIVDRLVNFQSWQALIKYGAEALAHKREEDFKGLIKFGTILDAGTALLGTIIATSSVYVYGHWQGWSQETINMATLYALVILFNLRGTPTAILRLFDRFKLFAFQRVIAASFKLSGVIVVFLVGAGLWGYMIVWMLTEVLNGVYLLCMGWRELNRKGIHKVIRHPVRGITKQYPGLWAFVWLTNLNSSIRLATREIDVMIVGGILGTTAVGLYKIAKQFSSILAKLTDPLYQVLYPELAKLIANGEIRHFKRFMFRSSLIAGIAVMPIWLVFVGFGGIIIGITVGPQYVAAWPVLVWYMLALVIAVFTFPLQPAMLAMGRPHASFWVHIVSTIIYFPVLYLMLKFLGLTGAGTAYVVYYIFWSLFMICIEARLLRGDSSVFCRE